MVGAKRKEKAQGEGNKRKEEKSGSHEPLIEASVGEEGLGKKRRLKEGRSVSRKLQLSQFRVYGCLSTPVRITRRECVKMYVSVISVLCNK